MCTEQVGVEQLNSFKKHVTLTINYFVNIQYDDTINKCKIPLHFVFSINNNYA